MGQVLIWILLLTTLLLFTAAVTASAYRRQRRSARVLLLVLGWIAVLPLLLVTFAAVTMAYLLRAYQWMPWAAVSMLVAFIIGVVLIRRKARRDTAELWPAGRLWLALAVSAALLMTTVWNLDLQARLRIQGYRAEAGMLLLSVAPPQVSEPANAALVYDKAFALMGGDIEFATTLDDVEKTPGEAEEFLSRHAETLRLIRQAAEMPEYRPDHDYSRPSIDLMLPELSKMRSAARLLALAAKHSAEKGDLESAFADINRLYGMSDHLGRTPILVSNLVAIGTCAVGHAALADVLPRTKSADSLNAIRFNDPTAWHRRAVRALRGEFAFGMSIICDVASGRLDLGNVVAQKPGDRSPPESGLFIRLFIFEPDMQAYQNYMRELSSLAAQPERDLKDVRKLLPDVQDARTGVLTSVLVPSLDRYVGAVAKAQAQDQMSRVMVAATRYRLDNSRYPETPDQLIPKYIAAMPPDPAGEGPVKMVLRDEGLVIYSIDDDKTDDGGEVDDDLHPQGKRPRDFGLILRTKPKPVVEEE